MRSHLNDLTVRQIPNGDTQYVWDSALPSFGLRVGKNRKTFVYKKDTVGSTASPFAGATFGSGGLLNFNAGDITVTHGANILTFAGGAFDFGGADLEIPNGSNNTVDAIGEIALDTTQNELLIATSTAAGAPGVMKMWQSIRFAYEATSTPGTGTSSRSLAVAPAAGYIDSISCYSNSFFRVVLYDAGGNRTNDLIASSTVGTVKFTQNNSFTENEPILVDIGTTTAPAALSDLGCTAKFFYTRN